MSFVSSVIRLEPKYRDRSWDISRTWGGRQVSSFPPKLKTFRQEDIASPKSLENESVLSLLFEPIRVERFVRLLSPSGRLDNKFWLTSRICRLKKRSMTIGTFSSRFPDKLRVVTNSGRMTWIARLASTAGNSKSKNEKSKETDLDGVRSLFASSLDEEAREVEGVGKFWDCRLMPIGTPEMAVPSELLSLLEESARLLSMVSCLWLQWLKFWGDELTRSNILGWCSQALMCVEKFLSQMRYKWMKRCLDCEWKLPSKLPSKLQSKVQHSLSQDQVRKDFLNTLQWQQSLISTRTMFLSINEATHGKGDVSVLRLQDEHECLPESGLSSPKSRLILENRWKQMNGSGNHTRRQSLYFLVKTQLL